MSKWKIDEMDTESPIIYLFTREIAADGCNTGTMISPTPHISKYMMSTFSWLKKYVI